MPRAPWARRVAAHGRSGLTGVARAANGLRPFPCPRDEPVPPVDRSDGILDRPEGRRISLPDSPRPVTWMISRSSRTTDCLRSHLWAGPRPSAFPAMSEAARLEPRGPATASRLNPAITTPFWGRAPSTREFSVHGWISRSLHGSRPRHRRRHPRELIFAGTLRYLDFPDLLSRATRREFVPVREANVIG